MKKIRKYIEKTAAKYRCAKFRVRIYLIDKLGGFTLDEMSMALNIGRLETANKMVRFMEKQNGDPNWGEHVYQAAVKLRNRYNEKLFVSICMNDK